MSILIAVITFWMSPNCKHMCTCTDKFAAVTQQSELKIQYNYMQPVPPSSQLLYSVVSDHTRKTHVQSMPCGCIHRACSLQAMHSHKNYVTILSSSWFALSFKMQKMRINSEIYFLSEKFTSKLQWVIYYTWHSEIKHERCLIFKTFGCPSKWSSCISTCSKTGTRPTRAFPLNTAKW